MGDATDTLKAMTDAEAGKVLLDWQLATHWQVRREYAHETCVPHILDIVDSLYALVNDRSLSLSRFGDGELGLMTGVFKPNSGYQDHDAGLAHALKDVITCKKRKCRVALPKWFMFWTANQNRGADRFVVREFNPSVIKGKYFSYYRPDYLYMDACLSVPCAHYGHLGQNFLSAYYTIAKKLFTGEDVLLVTGDTRYSTMQYRLLDETVKSLSVVKVAARNSWNDFARAKSALLDINADGSKTVVLSCGPLATVLAYELSDVMRCLDVGHMLVDYNLSNKGTGTGRFWR